MFTNNSGDTDPGSDSDPAPERRRGRPRGATARSAETRAHLYRVAIERFAADGFEGATLRSIAQHAGVSPGLLYRYFPSKRAIVLALYDDLSLALCARTRAMPAGRWRDRFLFALDASLEVLGPHRETLVALVPTLVGSPHESLFAAETAFSRERVQGTFVRAVSEATDAPGGGRAAVLGRMLDLVHLLVLLLWLLDRSDGQVATGLARKVLARVLGPFALAYRLPFLRGVVRDIDRIARDALGTPASS